MCVISPLAELGLFLVRVDNVGRVLIEGLIKLLNVNETCVRYCNERNFRNMMRVLVNIFFSFQILSFEKSESLTCDSKIFRRIFAQSNSTRSIV